MKIALSLSFVLGFGSLATGLLAAPPVNSDATPEAQKLLAFLTEIEGHYTLTAQHNFASSGSKYTREVEAITGKSPLIWGSDFSFAYEGPTPEKFQHCGPLNLTNPGEPLYYLKVSPEIVRRNMVATAIKEAKAGHIITLMWHAAPPGTPDGVTTNGDQIWTLARRPNQAWWNELTTEGTTLNHEWKKQADEIAGYLDELQAAHVPVLWRPFHEMNGVWFWWGAKSGDQGFKKLWIMMYNYFVHEKHLNNLIWVWDTNAPRAIPGDEAGPYTEYWPGSEYVEVLAADI
jgi:mannan endo-1,4-beta-mannosidase